MLKKLVALTLAALMLVNPMTAMAVTWENMLIGLEEARKANASANKYEEEGVTLEVEGTNAKIYGDGLLTDFYQVDEFTNYTFSGNITIGGEKFEVYAWGDQQVVVNIESGVGVTATEVRFGVDDNATLTVTTKGNIGFDADGTLVTERVSFDVSEEATANAKMEVVNEGDIAANENIWMSADGEGELVVTNDGTMTAENEIGMHVHGGAEGTLTNNGTLTANASGLGEEGAQVGIGVHGEGSATLVNSETGVINSELSGWIDSDAVNGTLNMSNDGTVNGNMGAWGFEGGYEDEEGNWVENTTAGTINLENTGVVNGSLGTFTNDNISSTATNSGTAESMFADNNGAGDITIENAGEVTDLSANANGEGNVTATNSGTVHNEMMIGSVGSGTIEATNSGTIEGWMHLYQEGDGESSIINEGTTNELSTNITETASGTANVTNSGKVEWLYSGVGGTATVVTTNTGTATDFHSDVYGEGNLTQINEGTVTNQFSGVANDGAILNNVNNGTAVKVGTDANGESTATMTNTGSITEAAWNTATGDAQVSASNSGDINYFDASAADSAVASLSNAGSGTVNEIYSFAGGEGAQVTVTNSGTAENVYANGTGEGSVTVSNSGTVNSEMWVSVDGEATGSVTNDGDVAYGGVGAYEDGSMIFENNGSYGDVFVDSMQNADMTATNNGEIGYVYTGVDNNATSSFTNNNTVGELWAESYGEGAMNATNNGTVDYKMGGGAYGEGQTTITNSGTIGDGEQNYDEEGNELAPDGVWGFAAEGGIVTVTNNGTVNGEIGGGAGEGSTATVNNNGTANSAWIDAHGGDVALNNAGAVSGTLSVSIGTQSNAVTDVETVAALLEQTGVNISGYETVEIYTANQDGQLIARYSVAEDGTVVLEEVIMQEKPDGPDVKSEERIRHEMEEKRKAAEIGGVFGSPYWLKQLYLGYMSLNLRLFDGEEQLLFKESVSWVPGTGKLGEKELTLNVQIEDTANLTMRLDGAVIDKLEQAGIVTINIVDGAGNLFMQYQVEDLKGARAMYGLTAKEYIVVGSADADVMKIAEDGTISPIEGETEPAEETPAA